MRLQSIHQLTKGNVMKNLLTSSVVALTFVLSSGAYAGNVYMYKNADGVMEFTSEKQKGKTLIKERTLEKTSEKTINQGKERMRKLDAYNRTTDTNNELKRQRESEQARERREIQESKLRETEIREFKRSTPKLTQGVNQQREVQEENSKEPYDE